MSKFVHIQVLTVHSSYGKQIQDHLSKNIYEVHTCQLPVLVSVGVRVEERYTNYAVLLHQLCRPSTLDLDVFINKLVNCIKNVP